MPEFRLDPVTNEWIIMAPERAKRPDQLVPRKKKRAPTPRGICPFEDLEKSGNWPPLFLVPAHAKRWRVAVIPNKYPALQHGDVCFSPLKKGPYTRAAGTGMHDLVVTRSHTKHFADMKRTEVAEVFTAFARRFRTADRDPCMAYVSAFFNYGPTAGASLYHPHYQMLTLPVIPAEVVDSLRGSASYYLRHHRCVHCEILKYEEKAKTRIIVENGGAVAVAPYVPKSRLEVSVYPKRHLPFFERSPAAVLADTAVATASILRRMRMKLNDPDLNFFIHTGPIRDQAKYRHYHWHIDVIPKVFPPPGGFELSTGADINAYDPDWFAAYLRGSRHAKT